MKHLRTFVLILLTVLLPIRGAVAAAVQCPGGVDPSSTVAATVHAHDDMRSGHDTGAQASATHEHAHGHAADETSPDTHASGCQVCAGGCCVTPLAFAPPSVKGPLLNDSAAFPALTARVSAHYPDGQDRPPRTV